MAKKSTKKKTPAPKTAAKKAAKKAPARAAVSKKTTTKVAAGTRTTTKKTTKTTAGTTSRKSAAPSANGKLKTAKANGTAHAAADAPDIETMIREGELEIAVLKKKKSGLTKKQLKYYRDLLLEKRGEILGDVASMQSSRGDGGNLSHMPVHMAEVGSDNFEQEFTLGLMESERKIVTDIDAALNRIDEGYYGICLITGQPIEEPRLEIKPWAKYCITIVRARERMGIR